MHENPSGYYHCIPLIPSTMHITVLYSGTMCIIFACTISPRTLIYSVISQSLFGYPANARLKPYSALQTDTGEPLK